MKNIAYPGSAGSLSISTLCGMAAMAFIIACTAHEAIGHGLACLGNGGGIMLLTSVYFRCRPGAVVVDAAGPLMSLVVAAIAAIVLRRRRLISTQSLTPDSNRTVFSALLLAYSGFWGAGYFIFSAATNTGDWAYVLSGLSLEPKWLWRLGMGMIGVWMYVMIFRMVSPFLSKGKPLVVAYFTAGLVACASVFFYHGPALPALREAVQEGMLAPLGLLLIALSRPTAKNFAPPSLPFSRTWIAASIVIIIIFWLSLGRGIYTG